MSGMGRGFDRIIVVAALNGLAMALALAGPKAVRPLSVGIIDIKDPYQKILVDRDARASAITASSRQMFEALGVWDHISHHAQDMREIAVSDGNGTAEDSPILLQFGDTSTGQPAMACLVETNPLLQGLLPRLAADPEGARGPGDRSRRGQQRIQPEPLRMAGGGDDDDEVDAERQVEHHRRVEDAHGENAERTQKVAEDGEEERTHYLVW